MSGNDERLTDFPICSCNPGPSYAYWMVEGDSWSGPPMCLNPDRYVERHGFPKVHYIYDYGLREEDFDTLISIRCNCCRRFADIEQVEIIKKVAIRWLKGNGRL